MVGKIKGAQSQYFDYRSVEENLKIMLYIDRKTPEIINHKGTRMEKIDTDYKQ